MAKVCVTVYMWEGCVSLVALHPNNMLVYVRDGCGRDISHWKSVVSADEKHAIRS